MVPQALTPPSFNFETPQSEERVVFPSLSAGGESILLRLPLQSKLSFPPCTCCACIHARAMESAELTPIAAVFLSSRRFPHAAVRGRDFVDFFLHSADRMTCCGCKTSWALRSAKRSLVAQTPPPQVNDYYARACD
ncbi:hypothetical protein KP509_21G061900 [Ceratopteris richardii]|uniref:Uncharacterized protein n=1 Tax=Ceratopteris richardii TaxID=49495 RepID=A0A8T2SDX1_CERRI|nr:hypothetical protein KP509_21G061900 [Ceratopteris richardii]KAH7315712.1 hypothetical protein KP509_21G061900 [Ceratopteris richardii]KAH7315713.1 hypothetical protein KP509_21G061900 [Ceratopteris richardii]